MSRMSNFLGHKDRVSIIGILTEAFVPLRPRWLIKKRKKEKKQGGWECREIMSGSSSSDVFPTLFLMSIYSPDLCPAAVSPNICPQERKAD